MQKAIFVERSFVDDGIDVQCRFYAPVKQPTGEFRCNWSLTRGDEERSHSAHGIDGVQALLLAMQYVHTEFVGSESYNRGKFTYLGEWDLGLPPPFGFEAAPDRQ